MNKTSESELCWIKGDEPRLCSVYKRPEKHIAAIPMKKTKSAAMARRALVALVSERW